MHGVTVRRLEIDDALWRRVVSSSPYATPFHHPDVVTSVAVAMGRETKGWGAWLEGELVGGIFVLHSPSARLTPVSAGAYNGPLLRDFPTKFRSSNDRYSSEVVTALCEAIRSEHSPIELRMVPGTADVRALVAAGWQLRPSFTYLVDIADLGQAWEAIDTNRKRLIRRAQRLGYGISEVTCPTGTCPTGTCPTGTCPTANEPSGRSICQPSESFVGQTIEETGVKIETYNDSVANDVERLHRLQEQGYGLPGDVDLKGWRELLRRTLGQGTVRLFVARSRDGQVVAFQLTAAPDPVASAATSGGARVAANLLTGACPEHLDSGVNGLLRWRVFERLGEAGFREFDLNGARPGAAGRFKASFGGKLVERWELIHRGQPSHGRTLQRFVRHLARRIGNKFVPTIKR
jgi:hypothetical protein